MQRRAWYIGCSQDDVGEAAILVGDRARVDRIALHLEQPVFLPENRGLRTVTGLRAGLRVTASAFGMGGPIAAIVFHELFDLGVRRFLRIGTAMVMPPAAVGDFVVADGAFRGDGTSGTYARSGAAFSAAPRPLRRDCVVRRGSRASPQYERAKPVPADWLEFSRQAGSDEGALVILFDEGEDRRAFDAAVVDATQAIIDDKIMISDSDRWFRSSRAEIEAHRDGPTLDAAGLSFFALTYTRLFSVSPETSHAAWLNQTRDVQLASAPLTGLIAVGDRYDRKATLAAGRVWQKLHLSATTRGLAMQPLNQPIEMIDRERQTGQGHQWAKRIARLTGDEWQATFSFRAGFASRPAPPSPRRRLKDVVLE